MERFGIVSVLKVERLVLVLRVWKNGTSQSRLGLESLKKMERLGLEG